jgi:hypothetical protein
MPIKVSLSSPATKTFNRPEHTLRIPFFLDTTKLSESQVIELMDKFEEKLGSGYFLNDRSLAEYVYNENHEKALRPFEHHQSYIGVMLNKHSERQTKSLSSISDLGATIYAHDQIEELLELV